MGLTRMAIAGLVGAGTLVGAPLLGLAHGSAPGSAAGNAPSKDAETAWVSPAEAAPGQSVTVSVTCETSSAKTVTANSQAFSTGSATLTVGPDGKYSGTARLASKEEFAGKSGGKGSSWGIDGSCPNGDTFTGAVQVALGESGGKGGGSWGSSSSPDSSGGYGSSGSSSGSWEGEKSSPHGSVHTGLGGSVGASGTQLAAGGALVAAGAGGFWLLRRRGEGAQD